MVSIEVLRGGLLEKDHKIYAKAKGPVQTLIRQPNAAKQKQGGLRLGLTEGADLDPQVPPVEGRGREGGEGREGCIYLLLRWQLYMQC